MFSLWVYCGINTIFSLSIRRNRPKQTVLYRWLKEASDPGSVLFATHVSGLFFLLVSLVGRSVIVALPRHLLYLFLAHQSLRLWWNL